MQTTNRKAKKLIVSKSRRRMLKNSNYKICEALAKTDGGQPWLLTKMPFFAPIYDKPRQKIVLLTSRQSTKSTYLRNILVIRSLRFPGNSALYVAPTNNQVGDFSRKKLDNFFAYTPELKPIFVPSGCAWNVTLKEFSVGGAPSRITLRSTGGAQGADRIRGGTYNDVDCDEFQDMIEEHLPVIEECAATFDGEDGRPLATYVYTGTPLASQNIIQKHFNLSKQWQWHMQCPHCSVPDPKQTTRPKSVDIYQRVVAKGGMQPPIGMTHVDPARPFLFCLHCGRDMNLPRGTPKKFDGQKEHFGLRIPPFGTWISHNPKGRYDGYRVVRMMMPWSRWRTPMDDGILDRLDKWPERQFMNEVMGLSFDFGTMPITDKMIYDNTGSHTLATSVSQAEKIAPDYAQYHCFAGLDWAAQAKDDPTPAYTILGVFALVNGRLKMVYAHRFVGYGSNNPEKILDHVRKIMHLFNVKRLGGDYGIGYKEMVRLMDEFGDHRVACFEYKAGGSGSKSTYDEGARKWLVPKTRTLDQLCTDITQGRFEFASEASSKGYTEDMKRVALDWNPKTRAITYQKTGVDDFLHVVNYVNLAKRFDLQEDDFGGEPMGFTMGDGMIPSIHNDDYFYSEMNLDFGMEGFNV